LKGSPDTLTTGAPHDSAARRDRASLLPIFLIVLVDVLGLTIVLPLLPLYAERFHASALVAALLVPTYSACQLVSGPFLGNLSDRVGRRPVLLVSQLGTCLGFLMIGRAESLWMLFAGRVLDGVTAGNLTVAQAYIADNSKAENRARSFALIGIAFGLGFMLGPVAAASLSQFSLHLPFYVAAGLSATSFLFTLTLLPREAARSERREGDAVGPGGRRPSLFAVALYARFFRWPKVNGILAEFFLYQLAFACFTSGFALFAERRFTWQGHPFTPREIGFTYAFGALVGLVVQGGLIGRLVKRFGEAKLVISGLITLGVGYTALGHVEPIAGLLVAIALGSFGNAVLRPTLTSLLSQSVSKEEQGAALGIFQSLASLAAITAAPISGWLIDHRHLQAWGWMAGVFCLLGLAASRFGSSLKSST
jgi:MFS family permease